MILEPGFQIPTWTITSSFDCSNTPSLRISDLGMTCRMTKILKCNKPAEDWTELIWPRYPFMHCICYIFMNEQTGCSVMDLIIWMHLKGEIQKVDSLWQHTSSVWPCLSLSVWAQKNLWRCNSTPGGKKNRERKRMHQTGHVKGYK